MSSGLENVGTLWASDPALAGLQRLPGPSSRGGPGLHAIPFPRSINHLLRGWGVGVVECRTWDREGGEGGNVERKKQGLGKCRTRKIVMGENSHQKKMLQIARGNARRRRGLGTGAAVSKWSKQARERSRAQGDATQREPGNPGWKCTRHVSQQHHTSWC